MKQGTNAKRWRLRCGSVGMAAVLSLVGAAQVYTSPAAADPSSVSGLINQIAEIDQNLADLQAQVATKQEAVNRALVDYQNAVAAQRLAESAAETAAGELDVATAAVDAAQESFDRFMRTIYRQGDPGSLRNYVTDSDPDQVIERAAAVERLAQQRRDEVNRLQVARNQVANRAAATEATRQQATLATRTAGNQRNAALDAVDVARRAAADEQVRRAELAAERDTLARRLAEIRDEDDPEVPESPVAGLPGVIDALPTPGELTDLLPRNPAAGDDALAQAAEAAARLALDVGQEMLAALVGQQQLPRSELLDELGLGGATLGGDDGIINRLSTGSLGSLFGSSGGGGGEIRPGLRGPQAVELVIDRAMSQLGVPYAWGGGDANGPTLGIRDGGVADSYGDYNKIGFDCSGLMIYAFAGIGYDLPHYTGYQYTSGPQVPLAEIQRGDMIFYGPSASRHVVLYLGDNQVIEAPASGDVVKISPLSTAGAMPMAVRLA